MQDIERLVKMANQIAENFSFHDDSVERTLDHMARFWASSMRERIVAHASSGGEGLSRTALAAVRKLPGA